jgi:protein involved in polysaccharide export with SLBB domain
VTLLSSERFGKMDRAATMQRNVRALHHNKGEKNSMRVFKWGMVVGMLTLVPAIARSQSKPSDTDSVALTAGSLRPGDFVVVRIWREPDLSDTVQIDHGGLAVFPKLGPIEVTGIRPDSLERLLVSRYSKYLQNPSIRVNVLRRITIWGAVARPGTYPVDQTMTITDALALAGGATPQGKADKVEVRRGSARRVLDLSGDSRQVRDLSLRSGDQLFVPERSWASRNAPLVVTVLAAATSLAWLIAQN